MSQALALLLAPLVLACFARVPPLREAPLRISEHANEGDAQRRASVRFVLEGLDADASFTPEKALPRYELALQVDPTNPYAYLALSRHYAEQGRGAGALGYLERAEAQLAAEGEDEDAPRFEAHRLGLRGWCAEGAGDRVQAQALLRRAARLAPEIWGDGRLSAAELR